MARETLAALDACSIRQTVGNRRSQGQYSVAEGTTMSITRWNVGLRSTSVLGATIVALGLAPAAAANFTVLYAFTGGSDGADPGAPLLMGANGSLLGTASGGARGNGVAFKLSPAVRPPWSLTVLYTFPNSPPALFVNPASRSTVKAGCTAAPMRARRGLHSAWRRLFCPGRGRSACSQASPASTPGMAAARRACWRLTVPAMSPA